MLVFFEEAIVLLYSQAMFLWMFIKLSLISFVPMFSTIFVFIDSLKYIFRFKLLVSYPYTQKFPQS